jgi:hypothetical protein
LVSPLLWLEPFRCWSGFSQPETGQIPGKGGLLLPFTYWEIFQIPSNRTEAVWFPSP